MLCNPCFYEVVKYIPTVQPPIEKKITADEILEIIAVYFNILKSDLLGSSRFYCPNARFIAMRLIYDYIQTETKTHIGKLFSKRHHTTVIYSMRKVDDLIFSDREFKKNFNQIKAKIDNILK